MDFLSKKTARQRAQNSNANKYGISNSHNGASPPRMKSFTASISIFFLAFAFHFGIIREFMVFRSQGICIILAIAL